MGSMQAETPVCRNFGARQKFLVGKYYVGVLHYVHGAPADSFNDSGFRLGVVKLDSSL